MIVHQQLAALAGGKSTKKLLGGVDLPMVDEGDPSFNPNHPSSNTRKKKTKKLKQPESVKTKKQPVVHSSVPAKRPTSK